MRATWDADDRTYSQGVSFGMLYPQNSPGVAWNGLVSVSVKGDDSPSSLYLDGQKYADRVLPTSCAGTIVAFTYPDEFQPSIGYNMGVTGQTKQPFGISYQTNRELHIIYNALADSSNDQYSSITDSVTPQAFSWDFVTTPVGIFSARPSAHLVVRLDLAQPDSISGLEDILYGDDANDPSLPDPATIVALFESNTTLTIVDNGDGTWTATGPDDVVIDNGDGTFSITWPSARIIDANTFTIQSL